MGGCCSTSASMDNVQDPSSKGKSANKNSDGKSFRENMLWEQKDRDVFKYYEVVKVLGEGSMGSVASAQKKESAIGGSAYKETTKKKGMFGLLFGDEESKRVEAEHARRLAEKESRASSRQPMMYALKSIILGRVTDQFLDELRNEIDILRTLDHPNIVKAYEVFESKRQMYIVMEYCSGGDLYARNPYTEKDAARIVDQLLSAISYMHLHNVVHRDLKFENIMWESKRPEAEIKVIDFGLSKKYLPGQGTMTEGVGTIYTMAPQVLQGVYTSQADLWSVGVITYMLLSNSKPFFHRKRRYVIDMIMRCDYNFNGRQWQSVTSESKEFVKSLIKLDPRERLTADEAVQHKWFSKEIPLSDRRPDEGFMDDVQDSLQHYGEATEFKKLALNVIAHKSSSDEIFKLRQAFDQYDTSNDGRITFTEFKRALSAFNYSPAELKEMFHNVDLDKNGYIYYTEFLAATLEAHGRIEEEKLADAFDRMDSDNTGFISKENLRNLLGSSFTTAQIEALIRDVDANNDGQISFDEFLTAFRAQNTEFVSSLHAQEEVQDRELVDVDAVIPGGKHDKGK